MRSVSSIDAKQRLAALLDAAQREPVMIRRQNRDVAVILSPQEYVRLRALNTEEFERFCDRIDEPAGLGLPRKSGSKSLPIKTRERVVIDTSTLVSRLLLLGSIPGRAVRKGVAENQLFASDGTITESVDVLAGPKFDPM